ncbi:MAG: hypothetical protein M3313_07940 [Actinomycetota bacterium]|nr:hypothetical protein [Actinomycetota bacterium]
MTRGSELRRQDVPARGIRKIKSDLVAAALPGVSVAVSTLRFSLSVES